jgi:hypothetical protein
MKKQSAGSATYEQAPACGPRLAPAIKQAQAALAEWMQADRRNTRFKSELESEDARLWGELLSQSSAGLRNQSPPLIRRGDLSSPIGVVLDGRRWDQFQGWYSRKYEPYLRRASDASGVPMLYGARISDRKGGHAESSEACYFLSFNPPPERQLTTAPYREVDGRTVRAIGWTSISVLAIALLVRWGRR